MAMLRVLATMIDDGGHTPDNETKLVFHLKVNNSNHIDLNMESFGYSRCWDEESNSYKKYPFILKDAHDADKRCRLDFGGLDEGRGERLNLDLKEVRKGETFTYFDLNRDQYIYRIESILEL